MHGVSLYSIKTVEGVWIMKGMGMTKKIIIALMVSSSGLQGIMSVQTKDMPVILPQTFIEASPILKNIEKDLILKKIRLHGLFQDQPVDVVLRVIDYQEELSSNKAVTIQCGDANEKACDLALIKRLKLNALLVQYRTLVQLPSN